MKSLYFTIITLSILLLNHSFAQSLSGNLKSEGAKSLGFANVDIFKNDKKVASVITDMEGNFSVKLDTGFYRVEYKYVGHEKIVKNIHVTGDVKSNVHMKKSADFESVVYSEEEGSRAYTTVGLREAESVRMEAKRVDSPIRSRTMSVGYLDDMTYTGSASSSLLTAGEINDFAKWEMWNDIATGVLAQYKVEWNLFLSERYTLQVMNNDGFPVVDAFVQLIGSNGKVQYESRTDNTGKAELWGKMGLQDKWETTAHAKIYFQGEEYVARKLSSFKEGINTVVIDALCGASTVVDIAFVVDATGSMGDEIRYLKSELNDIIYKSKNSHKKLAFNFANVFYRDIHDEYITRTQDFTEVLSESVNFINKQRAGGGGDYEEAVEIALNRAIDSLSWDVQARARILFLILDAPPHNTKETLAKMKAITKKAAQKGIRIVPIAASGIRKNTEYLMRTLALGTNGTYVFLTNHSGIGNSHIEPTTDEYDVETLNDILIRIIDSYTYVDDCSSNTDNREETKDEPKDSTITIQWNVWPNPTKGKISVKIDRDVSELFLTDITGKILDRFTEIKQNRLIEIDLSQYTKGIYLLTFTSKEKQHTKKVILQ